MEHIAYLDNSSTTKPSRLAVEYINRALEYDWGNPSSLHGIGIQAETSMYEARETVAKSIGAEPGEIIFTGSGTEANNTALLTLLKSKKRGGRVITTAVEHPSILETAKRLSEEGFEVIKLKPENNGVVALESLKAALTPNTVLVSMMLVNNETGAVMPVKESAELVRKTVPAALFHCDAVQGYGKLEINAQKLGVLLLTASAHKIHGPKGIGFLYCKKGVRLNPLITGGGQERGLRSGTEPLPLIMGFAGAVKELEKPKDGLIRQQELFDYTKKLMLETEGVVINSPDGCLPYILNISLPGYRSEVLLHFLESRGVYVSSGSACAKGHGSYVLTEMGLDRRLADSALRISFSRYNGKEDADRLYAALLDAKKQIRKAN